VQPLGDGGGVTAVPPGAGLAAARRRRVQPSPLQRVARRRYLPQVAGRARRALRRGAAREARLQRARRAARDREPPALPAPGLALARLERLRGPRTAVAGRRAAGCERRRRPAARAGVHHRTRALVAVLVRAGSVRGTGWAMDARDRVATRLLPAPPELLPRARVRA